MLHVTSQARMELHGLLMRALDEHTQDNGPGAPALGFRLVRSAAEEGEATRLGLALDAPRAGDEIVEHEGRSVLLVDAPTSELLTDLTLDVIETPDGIRLGLREE